jgi:hypothetical protein
MRKLLAAATARRNTCRLGARGVEPNLFVRAVPAIIALAAVMVVASCGESEEGATATTAPTAAGPTTTEPTTSEPTTTVAVNIREGDLLFADDFSDPNGPWGSEADPHGAYSYAQETYRIFVKSPERQLTRHLQGKRVEGIGVEIQAKEVAGTDGTALGIRCYTDVAADEGYMLVVAPADRNFAIYSFHRDSYQLLDGREEPIEGIRGVGKNNHLVVQCVRIPGGPSPNFLTLTVNGRAVGEAWDEELTGGGFNGFGMTVDTAEGGADGRFDDLVATELVPE